MTGMAQAATARHTHWAPVLAAAAASIVLCATIARYGVQAARDELSTVFDTQIPHWLVVPVSVAAAVCVVAAWLSLARPFVSAGLMLVLLGWLAPSWADVDTFSQRWRVAFLAAGPLVVAGVGLAVAATGKAPRSSRRWVTAALAVSTAAVAVIAFGYDPFEDPNCQAICTDFSPVLSQKLTTSRSIELAAVLTLAAAAVVVTEMVRMRPPRNLLLAASLTLVPAVIDAIGSLSGRSGRSTLVLTLAVAGPACLGAVIAIRQLRTLKIRRTVERLAEGLSAHERPGAPVASDVRAVHFAMPDEHTWVDGDGRPVPSAGEALEPQGRRSRERWLVLADDDGPAIRLALTPAADGDGVLAGLSAATRLALRNARLAAVGRARLIEVQTSKRRVVAAWDDERRRVERDLHDGAQQRLVSIAFQLSAARGRVDPSTAPGLERAEAAVREALAGLRRLAQGVFPSALAEDGLAAALEDFLASNDIDAVLDVSVRDDLDLQVAMAAYAVATRALSLHARSSSAARLCVDDLTDLIRVSALIHRVPDQPDDAFDDVRDRVGALGGTLTIQPGHAGDLDVTAVIPCASS